MEAQASKDERFELRVSSTDERIFKRAQKLSGDKSFSSFIVWVVKQKAEEIAIAFLFWKLKGQSKGISKFFNKIWVLWMVLKYSINGFSISFSIPRKTTIHRTPHQNRAYSIIRRKTRNRNTHWIIERIPHGIDLWGGDGEGESNWEWEINHSDQWWF